MRCHRWRRIAAWCLGLAGICAGLSGCGRSPLPIEGMDWELTSVQHIDAPEGIWDAVTEETEAPLTCTLSDGKLYLSRPESGESWEGSYQAGDTDPRSTTTYEVSFGEKDGRMVSGLTTYLDGSQDGTLIITCDGYTLRFLAEWPTES